MGADEQAVYGVDSEGMVTIYRSTPSGTINTGDWVTTDKSKIPAAAGNPIVEQRVPASSLVRRAGDDEDEFGYVGPHTLPTPLHKPQDTL
jgi:hypothetical protein